jgi:hypothetical protein
VRGPLVGESILLASCVSEIGRRETRWHRLWFGIVSKGKMVNSRLILFFLLWRGRVWQRGFRRWGTVISGFHAMEGPGLDDGERGGVALRCDFLLLSGLGVGFHVVLCASSLTWFIVVPRRVHFYRRGEMFHVPDLCSYSRQSFSHAHFCSLSSLFLLLPFSKP